jgi:lipopolysaccharide biosynthesis regulator YciM
MTTDAACRTYNILRAEDRRVVAALLMLEEPPQHWPADTWPALRAAVARAAKPLQRYRCAACGFEAQHYFWQCPGCLNWDSYPPQRIDAL